MASSAGDELSPGELQLRQKLLRSMQVLDTHGTGVLDADDFPKAVTLNGLSFGDAVVDRIMLLCEISGDGHVDYTRFAADCAKRAKAERDGDTQYNYEPRRTPASGKGAEFHAALAAVTGVDEAFQSAPPEIRALTQAERVRKLAQPMRKLFAQYDNGHINGDVFREGLKSLGLDETPGVVKLLRHGSPSFAQIVRALTVPAATGPGGAAGKHSDKTPVGGVFGTSLNTDAQIGQGRSARVGAYRGVHASSVDPIGWTDSQAAAPAPRRTGYIEHSDIQNRDTGASRTLYGRAIGSTVDDVDAQLGKITSAGKAGHRMPESTGAAEAIFGYGYKSSFETAAQRTARKGLGQSGGPKTSAGYNSADHGLLREQVYSAIRGLDRGALTSKGFRLRMKALGADIPMEVERLLVYYDATGRADFKRYVTAFEDFFAAKAAEAPARRSEASVPEQKQQRQAWVEPEEEEDAYAGGGSYMDGNEGFDQSDVPAALRAHGDILTWSNAPKMTQDEYRAMVHAGIRPGQKRKMNLRARKNAAGVRSTVDGFKPVEKNKAKTTCADARRGAGNIIAWASGQFVDADGRSVNHEGATAVTALAGYGGGKAKGGDLLPDGTPTGGGRARVHTKLAKAVRARSVPFGTKADEGTAPPESITGSRRAHMNSLNFGGGDWMAHHYDDSGEKKKPVRPVTEPAPWAKDWSDYDL